ncbi:hypothetical protein L1887_07108 [Cichorium endivia]|nr:hypothetical protein L1887_07108 [Cichorium endivia]
MATSSKSGGTAGEDTVVVAPCNITISMDLSLYKEHVRILIHIISRHQLARAFFDKLPTIPVSLLERIVLSAKKHGNHYLITLSDGREVPLDTNIFVAALEPTYHQAQFDHPPPHQLQSMIYRMGYAYKMETLSQFSKGNISPI